MPDQTSNAAPGVQLNLYPCVLCPLPMGGVYRVASKGGLQGAERRFRQSWGCRRASSAGSGPGIHEMSHPHQRVQALLIVCVLSPYGGSEGEQVN